MAARKRGGSGAGGDAVALAEVRELRRPGLPAVGDALGAPPRTPEAAGGVVLGIDPGTLALGYGAVRPRGRAAELVEAGVVRVAAARGLADRLGFLQGELEALLALLRPSVVVVERVFARANVQSALRVGEARGVALAAAVRSGARVVELSAPESKRALCGNGRAAKHQVAAMVARLLAVDPAGAPHDTTDALALALAHCQGAAFARALARAERSRA